MRFCYKDIKEIIVLVTSYRNPATLRETVKESQLVAEQKRTADPGPHRNPLLSFLGTWGLCVLFPLCCLSRRSCFLPGSLWYQLSVSVTLSHTSLERIQFGLHDARKGPFRLQGCRGGSHPGNCFLEPSGAVSQSRVCRRHLWRKALASPGNPLLSTLRVCSDSRLKTGELAQLPSVSEPTEYVGGKRASEGLRNHIILKNNHPSYHCWVLGHSAYLAK